jgi:hypothetical protein
MHSCNKITLKYEMYTSWTAHHGCDIKMAKPEPIERPERPQTTTLKNSVIKLA